MELRPFFFKTLIVAGIVISLFLVYQLRSILVLFFIAILFASTVRPAVRSLSERGIPPFVTIPLIYVVFLAALAGIVIVLLPSLLVSATGLLNSQGAILTSLEGVLERIETFVAASTGARLPPVRIQDIQAYVTQFQATSDLQLQELLVDSFRVLSEALILFVLAFYWLTERDHFENVLLKMIPLRHRERFSSIVNQVESTLGAYVRGQTILCVTVGVFAFIALSLLGVRSALMLSVFAALMEAIPMIGPFLGAIPAILVALLDSPEKALVTTLAFIIIQQIEAQILVPKVMERQVGLSPLVVLLALTAGNLLGGLVGALVAIPIAAALMILLREFVVTPTVQARQFPVVEGAVLLDDSLGRETEQPETPPPATPPIVTESK